MTDLFGDPPPPLVKNPVSGYAAKPGSGPANETCGTCYHATKVEGGNKSFWKCAILRHRWTHGLGTDIRLKSPACARWKAWEGSPEYLLLLSLIERTPRDAEPRDNTGIVGSEKDLKELERFRWIIPTPEEARVLEPGMFIRNKGQIHCWSMDKTKWLVEVK